MNVDFELEACVLSAMIVANEIIPNVKEEITDEDFFGYDNKQLYGAITRIYEEHNRVDLLMLMNDKEVNKAHLLTVVDKVATGANVEYYIGKLKKVTLARNLTKTILSNKDDITPENADKVLCSIQTELARISDVTGGKKIRGMQEITGELMKMIEKAYTNSEQMLGFESGFENLDRITLGIQKEYIIIGARPSIGKSALSMQIAQFIAEKKPVGYFSLEMSGESLGLRTLSKISGISATSLKSGRFGKAEQLQRIQNGMEKIYNSHLLIVDKIKGTLSEVKNLCRQMVRQHKCEVIFIDHVSLIKPENPKVPRYEQFAEISNELQKLQRELGIALVVVMQLGRGTEGKPPELSDLRESGAFEQDADCVMLLHRERVTEQNTESVKASLLVAKNRNGACGMAKLVFKPRTIQFTDEKGN